MQKAALHPLAEEYLARVEAAARRLPRRDRHELVEAIEDHLLAAQEAESLNDAEVLNMLDDLGDPEDVVTAAAPDSSAVRPGLHEIAAVLFLLVGAFVIPAIGWFVGVVLLWSSSAWTKGQKWLGTLVVPGGLAAPLGLMWFGPRISRCETARDFIPPPDVLPLPLEVGPSAGQVDTGTLRMCSEEALTSTWPGVLLAVLLGAAGLAVAVYLLRSVRRSGN